MATNTSNLGLIKPAYSDIADIADLNANFDDIDSSLGGMSIIVNGNKTSYASGVAIGQFVTLVNSTIVDTGATMIHDGIYTAAKVIPYNTEIDKTYLAAVSGGALNAINSNLSSKLDTSKVYNGLDKTATGFALDASQGKALNDKIAKIIKYKGSVSFTNGAATVKVTGARSTSAIVATFNYSDYTAIVLTAWCSSNDYVSLRLYNAHSGSAGGSSSFSISIIVMN